MRSGGLTGYLPACCARIKSIMFSRNVVTLSMAAMLLVVSLYTLGFALLSGRRAAKS